MALQHPSCHAVHPALDSLSSKAVARAPTQACRARRCLVTMSSYTGGEDFSKADRVVSELGDSGADVVHVADLTAEALQKHK